MTLGQHGFKLHKCTYTRIFFNSKYCTTSRSKVGSILRCRIADYGETMYVQRTGYKLYLDFQLSRGLAPLTPLNPSSRINCINKSSFPSLLQCFLFFLFSFGRAAWLAGSQFPDQGLNQGHHSESAKSLPLDHQGTPCSVFFLHVVIMSVSTWILMSIILSTLEQTPDYLIL